MIPLLPPKREDDQVSDDVDEALQVFVSEDIEAKLIELFASFDLEQSLRRMLFGGFDSYKDYEKYGDMYVELEVAPDRIGRRSPLVRGSRGTATP